MGKKKYDVDFELLNNWDIQLDNSLAKGKIPPLSVGLVFEFDFSQSAVTSAITIESKVLFENFISCELNISGASLTLYDNRTLTPYAI